MLYGNIDIYYLLSNYYELGHHIFLSLQLCNVGIYVLIFADEETLTQ